MARTVSVKLSMEIAEYIANGGRAEEKLVEIGEAAKLAADKGTKGAKERSAAEEDAARVLGKAQADGLTGYQALGKAIDDEKAKLLELRKAYGSSSGSSSSILGDIKASEKDLKSLEDLASTVGMKGGQAAGDNFIKMFGNSVSGLPLVASNPYVAAAMVSAGAALAIPLVASLDGVLAAGIGAGGIALGITAAARTPEVSGAFSQLKADASGIFSDIGQDFKAPVVAGIHDITGMLKSAEPGLKSTFSQLAADARPLIDGLGGFISAALPNLEQALGNAEPFVKQLAVDLPQLGADVSKMLDEFTQGGPGAVDAMHGLLALIGKIAVATGWVGKEAGQAFGQIEGTIDFFKGNVSKAEDEVRGLNSGMGVLDRTGGALSSTFGDLGISFHRVATTVENDLQGWQSQLSATQITFSSLEGEMTDKVVGGLLASDQATNTFNKSLVTLGDTLVANGGHLSAHVAALKKSETGTQQNTDAVLAVVQANLQVYDSMIAVGISSDDAAKKYDENTRALKDQLKAAGYLPNQIQALIGKYEQVPDKINTDVAMNGLTDAINGLDNMIRILNGWPPLAKTIVEAPGLVQANDTATGYEKLLNELDGRVVTTTMDTKHIDHFTQTGAADPSTDFHGHRWGGAYEHAAVGTLREATTYSAISPGRYMIAEPQTGGEAFVPKRGDYGRSMGILGQAAGWYGARVVPGGRGGGGGVTTFRVSAEPGAAQALMQVLRVEIEHAGGIVQDALGR